MPRNFGVRRNLFGAELSRYWHANDNQPEDRWPIAVFVASVLLIVAIGIFIA